MIKMRACCVGLACLLAANAASAETGPSGLLFRVSADKGFAADIAGGDPTPNFQDKVKIVQTGIPETGLTGTPSGAIEWPDDGVLTWLAPGNIYSQRGTLSFFWRSRTPVGQAPFVLFRVGYADHTSWDMCFLRIDWNGHGFDAFVTDANLSRIRLSFTIDKPPAPDAWIPIAFSWDENRGVRLYVDGKEAARKEIAADLDSGLDGFGLAARVVSPHQVQSRYSFLRGSDFDEIRIYDHMLEGTEITALARNEAPAVPVIPVTISDKAQYKAWLHRFGWDDGKAPPLLSAASTTIRKVEFADAKDKKEWMWKATDGIQETTWPGVYNRSRLPGRTDYFQLPDWNVYVEGGQALDLTLPDEPFNRLEIRGAAFGALDYAPPGQDALKPLAKRAKGVVRTTDQFETRRGGHLRFTNVEQETPIQEIWAYNVTEGAEPEGTIKLNYTIQSSAAPDYDNLASLRAYIAGRHPLGERATVVALPPGAASRKRAVEPAGPAPMPLVHVLIPSGFGDPAAAQPLTRAWAYGWENMHDGLDGIAIDIPALNATPVNGVIPLNIQVKDPIWPDRDLIDVSVSVKPNEARTVWLDLRDRILSNDSFYLTVASASPDFGAASLDGAKIRLVFKEREQAKIEHVADRFNQVKDNWGYLVEEHPASKRERLFRRVWGDITDLLRVDPDNLLARYYWSDIAYGSEGWPAFKQPEPPAGVPLWAFRQTEDLKLVRRYINWWIDNRQVPYGDFGGGISDDTDLTEQWPGLALMGADPDKIRDSLNALCEAAYKNDMFTGGLATLVTDELHSYEDGINSNSEAFYLNWGEPRVAERLMQTAKDLTDRIILTNPQGHMHFASNWFGGPKVYREGPWEWGKPYSYVITHPLLLLGQYNANPIARKTVIGLADGYLAHGKQGQDGVWSFPEEINWRTDAERGNDLSRGTGLEAPLQDFWAAWRWTGDAKYLRPLESVAAKAGPQALGLLNENVIDVTGHLGDWGKTLTARAGKSAGGKGDGFDAYTAWLVTGDLKWLEKLHAAAIQSKSQTLWMHTEGHWWVDRVELPSEILQRERLGGVALKRNHLYPGHTVSWRFAEPDGAEQVAILLSEVSRDHFKVTAYNLADHPLAATMTAWNVTAGHWRVSDGRKTDLESSASVDLSFAPRQTSVFEFTLDQPVTPTEQRADLGIGRGDVAIDGHGVHVTVHSLGALPAPGGTLTLVDPSGKVVASAKVPALDAPADLLPKTAVVTLVPPKGVHLSGTKVEVTMDGGPEVTRLNNSLLLP